MQAKILLLGCARSSTMVVLNALVELCFRLRCLFVVQEVPMKNPWLVIASLLSLSLPVRAFQADTPQGALEEIATTNKPEVLVRHLPEPIQKSIEALPRPKKSEVMSQLMQMKAEQLNNYSLRRAGGDTWEMVDEVGDKKGTVTLENAFISGLDALLPLHITSSDGSDTLIVTMHLEGNEWRIQDFGHWEKSDTGMAKLLHEPTELEKNEKTARETLCRISGALYSYARSHGRTGFPSSLKQLTVPPRQPLARNSWLLEEEFAAEPLVMSGYEFRYLLIMRGNGADENGTFELRATPLEFGTTGVKSFLLTSDGTLHSTGENRPATEDDDRDTTGDRVVFIN
jgi:hypothetical protein